MDFTPYPIKDSSFHENTNVNILKSSDNCLNTVDFKGDINPNVSYGYHKPLNEVCKPIKTNHFNIGPEESNTGSIWNNMTKRKTLVKDY